MRKKEHFTADYTKHFVMEELALIKGYKLTNETTETPNIILDGLEIVLDSLVDYEKSFLDFRDECPDECTDEEIDSIVNRVRYLQNLVSSIMDGVEE